MTAVHRLSMLDALKHTMRHKALLLFIGLMSVPAFAQGDDNREIYNSFLSCAAFHTIEATKSAGNAAAAQEATAYDYAKAAAYFAPDGRVETANADLKTTLEAFQARLSNGEPRAMAEQWTALETSCRELHPLKDTLVDRRRAEMAPAAPESR